MSAIARRRVVSPGEALGKGAGLQERFWNVYSLDDIRLEDAKNHVDALNVSEEIPGDIYKYWAIRKFCEHSDVRMLPKPMKWSLMLGCLCVFLLQIFAPVLIIVWAYAELWPNGYDHDAELESWTFSSWFRQSQKQSGDFADLGIKVVGLLFSIVFVLNARLVNAKERDQAVKMHSVVELLHELRDQYYEDADPPQDIWLWVGAIVNSYLAVICSLCLYPTFLLAESPKDIVFDSLSLMFLIQLDNVAGDLGFIDDTWCGKLFGEMYADAAKVIRFEIGGEWYKAKAHDNKGTCFTIAKQGQRYRKEPIKLNLVDDDDDSECEHGEARQVLYKEEWAKEESARHPDLHQLPDNKAAAIEVFNVHSFEAQVSRSWCSSPAVIYNAVDPILAVLAFVIPVVFVYTKADSDE